ncbi:hypothetical protein [Vibrio pectenicida]|uniref:hypothetical protein n=1 Tax=Vibrio pectenicida TaxID=62763 RepID=UPI001C101306|nr:hypothetical protein [Vibrio pectenicida]
MSAYQDNATFAHCHDKFSAPTHHYQFMFESPPDDSKGLICTPHFVAKKNSVKTSLRGSIID